jgi:HAD superfamily hydrolase (TIGR01509 family)
MTFIGGMATIAVIAAKHAKCSRTRTLTAAGSTAVPPPGHPAPGSGGTPRTLPVLGVLRSAWRGALSRLDIDLSVWRIHRRIGMSGGLFVSALLRETGLTLSEADIAMLQQAHQEEYLAQADSVRPLPGAAQLLAALTKRGVQWAIATSGYRATAGRALGMLGLPEDAPMITRDMVRHAKPDPDLFLAAAALLDVDPKHAYVVGDSVWDLLAARRAGSIGIGLMSGGYGREELERAGAYRVYADPADMLARADELGVRDLGP